MGYKKITVSSNPTAENESSAPFVKTTTAVEIKDCFCEEAPLAAKQKKTFPINGCALFISLCAVLGLLFIFIPIPEPFENFLENIIFFVSEDGEETKIPFIPEGSTFNKNTSTIFADIPACEKSAFGNELPILQASEISISSKGISAISNETKYNIDFDSLMSQSFPIQKISLTSSQNDSLPVFSQIAPEVLIIHTHGTEGYEDCAFSNYRTHDTSKNVVAVGKALASELEAYGISVIHCEEMFDKDSYIKAYSNSYSKVAEYLSKYPSIKYVIDVHRDAVPDGEGGYAKLVCDTNGETLAQLMLVVGTDEAGAKHKEWTKNLRTAAEIQKGVFEENENLMRPLNLRKASFNQQLSSGYFILEAGNCANTLEEAKLSMSVFAKSFAKTAGGLK